MKNKRRIQPLLALFCACLFMSQGLALVADSSSLDLISVWEEPGMSKEMDPNPYPDVTIETYDTPKEEIPPPPEPGEDPDHPTKSSNSNSKIERAPYKLKIGDQLFISLYGFREAPTQRLVTVDATGSISYLFINKVYALGKTIDALRKDLQEKVKLQYPNVIVTASAVRLVGNSYTIMGEINSPGTKSIAGDMTVLAAIAEGGGFPLRSFRTQTIDYADLEKAFLSRNGEYIPVDFEALVRDGDLNVDVPLEGGDYIYIPSIMTKEIYVLGEINRQFVYSYIRTASLTEVIAWGRGLTLNASSRVAVIRGSLCNPTSYLIDVNLIFKGCQPDFILCPGDIVYIPPRKFNNFREIVRMGIRTWVGSFASEAGTNALIQINPAAANNPNITNGNNVLINPGTVTQPPPTVIIGP